MVEPYDNPLLRHARRERDRAVVALFRRLATRVVVALRAAAMPWIERVRSRSLLRELHKLRATGRANDDVIRLIASLEAELARGRRLTRPSAAAVSAWRPPARMALARRAARPTARRH